MTIDRSTFWFVIAALFLCPSLVLGQELVRSDQRDASSRIVELLDTNRIAVEIIEAYPDNTRRVNAIELEASEVLRWGRGGWPSRSPIVHLVDGTTIVARSVELDGTKATVRSATFEPIDIPASALRAISFNAPTTLSNWLESLSQIESAEGRDDRVLIDRKQWVNGLLKWNSATAFDSTDDFSGIKINTNGQELSFLAPQIDTIIFSPILTPMIAAERESLFMGLNDGTRLHLQGWKKDSNQRIALTTSCGVSLVSTGTGGELAEEIASLHASPADVQFLSDLEPASYRHLNLFGTKWELGKDRDLWGRPLLFRGGTVAKGLAMHSSSQVAYRWDGKPGEFLATFCLAAPQNDAEAKYGGVIGKVLVARDSKLETVWTSQTIQKEGESKSVQVSLEGAKLLVLVVEGGPAGQTGDHILWLDARIHTP